MRILYGIQCTGNGHITRSLKVITKLKNLGHTVDILLSGKNFNIILPFEVKYRLNGFTFYNTANGGINYLKTITSFKLSKFLKDINMNVDIYDKVISDFEPITAWACKISGKKCYGISNQYSFISENTPRQGSSIIGESILKWMAPVSDPIGLHFKEYDNFIYKPIISDDIINYKSDDYGHSTIYLPSYSLYKTVSKLVKYPKRMFHIFNAEVKSIYRYENTLIYPVDKRTFINSFINCHSIITNSGFQTTSEALYMSKKLMVISTKGQYEQECNAEALHKMGIFSGRLSNVGDFMESNKVIIDRWDDPTDSIINKILN
jgi:uncharacterized protein (TIGR00661 family)